MKVFCLILSLLVIAGCQDIGPQKKSLARISISNEGKRVGKNVEQNNLAQTSRKRKGKNIITKNPIRQKIEEKVRSEIENIIQNEIENVMSKIKRKGKKVIFSGSSPAKKVINEANVQPHPNSRHSKKMILRKPTENKNIRNVNNRKNMNPEKRLGKNLDISVKGSNSKNNKSTGIPNRTGRKIKSNPFGPMKRKGRRRQKKPKQGKRLRNTRKRKIIEQKAPKICTNTKTTNKNRVRNMKAKQRQSKNIKGSDIVSKNKENRSNILRNGKLVNLKRKGKKMQTNKKRNGQSKRRGKLIKQNRNLKKNTKPFNKLERNNEHFNKRRGGRRIKIKNNDVLGRNRMQRVPKKPIHRRNRRSPIPLWKPVELEEDPIPQWKPVELEEEDSLEHLNLMNDSLTAPQPNTQGAGSAPGPEAGSVPGLGADSAPGPGEDSVPEPGADSDPGPVADSAPGPGEDSVPEPGADSDPGPGADSDPRPGADSAPGPEAGSAPGPEAGSAPGPGAGSTPGPEAGSTPGPGAGSTPAGPPEGRYSLIMNPYINLPPNIPRPVAGVGQLPPNFRLPLQRPPGPLQRIQPNAKPTLPSPPNAILTNPSLMEKIFRMFKSTEVRTALAELADSLYEQIDTTNIKLKNMLEQKVDGILKKMVMTIYEDTGVSVHDCLTKDYDISCISDDEDSPELPMETPKPSNDTQKKISIPDDKPVETIPKDLNETPLDNDENEISKDIPTSNNESLESPPKEQANLDKDTPNETTKPNDEELTEIPVEAGNQSMNGQNETEPGDTSVPSNSPDEAFKFNAEYESMVEPPTYLDISDYYSSPVNDVVSPIEQTSGIDSIIGDSSIRKDLEEQVKDVILETLNTLSGSENNLVDDSDLGISDDKLLDENHPDGNDQSVSSDSNVVGDETDSILESSLMPLPTFISENDQFTIEEHESSANDASDSSPDYYSQADYAPLLDYISSSGYGAMSNSNPSAEYISSADYNPSADYISSADYNPIAGPSAENNPASDYNPSADYAASWAYNPDVDFNPSADYSMNDLVDDVKDNPVADYSSSSDSSILDNNAPSAEEMPSNDLNSVDDLRPAAYYDSDIDYVIGEEYVLDGDYLTHQTPQLESDILADDSIDNIPLSDVLSKAHVSLTDSVSSTDQVFLADNDETGDYNDLADYSSSAENSPQGEYTSLSGNIPADYNELLDNSIDDNPQNDNTLTETIDADQIQPGEDVSLVEMSPIDKNVALISKPKDHEMAIESELEQANQELIEHKEKDSQHELAQANQELIEHKEKDSQHELEQANQEFTEHNEKDSQHETPINVPTVDFRVQDEVAASLYDNYQNYAEATLSDNEIDAYYYDSSQNIASDNIDPNGDLPVPNALEINDKLVEAAVPSLYEDYY